MIFYSKLLIIILKLNALSLNKCELYMNMSYLILVILYKMEHKKNASSVYQ